MQTGNKSEKNSTNINATFNYYKCNKLYCKTPNFFCVHLFSRISQAT